MYRKCWVKKSFFTITQGYRHVARLQNTHIWCREKKGISNVTRINLRNLLSQDTMEAEELGNKGLEELLDLLKIGIFKKDGYLCIHQKYFPALFIFVIQFTIILYNGMRTKLHSFLWFTMLMYHKSCLFFLCLPTQNICFLDTAFNHVSISISTSWSHPPFSKLHYKSVQYLLQKLFNISNYCFQELLDSLILLLQLF